MANVFKSGVLKNVAGYSALTLALSLPGMETAAMAKAPATGWAKAGVSLEQYRADALECGTRGLATNIDDSEPVGVLRKATRELESLDAGFNSSGGQASSATGSSAENDAISRAQDIDTVKATARPNQQIKRIKEIMIATARTCMAEHGYTRFALTEGQRAGYDKVSGGSPEHIRYLHALASDPAVLESQKQPLPNSP